jgi:hypothetical protein
MSALNEVLHHNPLSNLLRKQQLGSKRGVRLLRHHWRSLRQRLDSELVPLDHLLCGGENGLGAAQYARHSGDLLRPSTQFLQSPQVCFLQEYLLLGEAVFRPENLRKTKYFQNALECIRLTGYYFSCRGAEQIEEHARTFVARLTDEHLNFKNNAFDAFSDPLTLPVVRPISYSEFYEVIDGNHRLALAYVKGAREHRVRVIQPPTLTPLQQLVLDFAWCRGRLELYQPIDSPELGNQWALIRRCADRFAMMKSFLAESNLLPPHCQTYLDIASSYGWFVRAFTELGFAASGVEIDWAAGEIGRLAYGLQPNQITRSDVVPFLQENSVKYDVTSCFSLLHHFAIGRASISAEDMLRLVDRATGAVMFFDSGEGHEDWFRELLPHWTPDFIEEWLKENSSFTRIYRLGVDSDKVPPFQENYGRTLFACLR